MRYPFNIQTVFCCKTYCWLAILGLNIVLGGCSVVHGGLASAMKLVDNARTVEVEFIAGQQLNLVRKKPKPLHVCVYLVKAEQWIPERRLDEQNEMKCLSPQDDIDIVANEHVLLIPQKTISAELLASTGESFWVVLDFNFSQTPKNGSVTRFAMKRFCNKTSVTVNNDMVNVKNKCIRIKQPQQLEEGVKELQEQSKMAKTMKQKLSQTQQGLKQWQ